jgi:exodeoxyribonuclease VII small subunit
MSENNFEKQLKRLQEIADKLESQDLSIDETLKLFEEGMKLSKDCKKSLEEIEMKVQKIVGEENNTQMEDDDDF